MRSFRKKSLPVKPNAARIIAGARSVACRDSIGAVGLIGIAVITLMFVAGCQGREEAGRETAQQTARQTARQTAPQPSPENAAAVAIYSDRGVWPQSVIAAERMFRWMGCQVSLVDARQVRRGALAGARLLCVPGGNMYNYAEDLSPAGVDTVRAFVRRGGGYIGICGGAYFAAQRVFWQGNQLPMNSLGLFPGEARGPYDEIVPYPDSAMCLVITSRPPHPITEAQPDSAWILYFWGPALLPDDSARVTILGRYDAIDRPAMLACEYGRGRAFLIGAHPEIEEDSDRDGVTECDELEDRGTDWELMRAAAGWCLGE